MQGTPILQEGLDPGYKLTRGEVDAWMNSHKNKLCLLPAQVALARVDKLAGCQSTQRLNLQRFLTAGWKTVELCADMKPLVKRRSTNQSKDAKARKKRTYNEFLAKDLMDPANATKRTARHFILIRETVGYTR